MGLTGCGILFLLACPNPALAQDRAWVGGIVSDAVGRPVAATVVLWSDPALGEDAGDRVAGGSGADGRFRLEVRRGRTYSGYASREGEASPVVEVSAGDAALRLRLDAAVGGLLSVSGGAAWREEGPLRLALVVPARARCELPVSLDKDGRVKLPSLPPGEVFLAVRTSRDELLTLLAVPRAAETRVVLPPPVRVTVRVVDDHETPVAGAVVRHLAAASMPVPPDAFACLPTPQWRQLGVSGADGLVVARLTARRGATDGVPEAEAEFAASKAGFAEACAKWTPEKPGGDAAEEPVVNLRLAEVPPYRIRLRHGDRPLAGRRVVVLARALAVGLQAPGLSVDSTERSYPAVSDQDGVVTVPDMLPHATELRLTIAHPPGEELPAWVPLPNGRLSDPEVDLARAHELELTVVDSQGKPVPACRGIAMWAPGDLHLLAPHGGEPAFVTDARGRARLLLPAGRWWIFAAHANGFAHALVPLEESRASLELELVPFLRRELQVTDPGGRALAGARLTHCGSEWIDGTPIPDDILRLQFLGAMDRHLVGRTSSDGQGRLVVWSAPTGVSRTFGRVTWNDRWSGEVRIEPGAKPLRVVVR